MTNAVSKLIETVKKGAVGEIMTDDALEVIGKAISEVDAAALFAAAGQLELEPGVYDTS